MADALTKASGSSLTSQGALVAPITELDLILQACDPGKPLTPGDKRYADFTDLRQGVSVKQLEKALTARYFDHNCLHACLSGHRGSGKSTELLFLKQWADENGFFTVRTEVDEALGMIPLDSADLFLLAARSVEAAMAEAGHPIPSAKLKHIVQWFAEVVQEDEQKTHSELNTEAGVQLGGKVFTLGGLFAKFTAGLKASSDHAVKTRQRLRNYPDHLADLTKDLLRSANEILQTQGKPRGLLLLFDNLDRYEPEIIDKTLFRGRSLVERLACHAIFTIPIALEYEPLSGAIQDYYGFSLVLPMLSMRKKSDPWASTVAESKFDAAAVAKVRAALEQRIVISQLFEKSDDADLLIKMSGGCIRDLMHLLTLSFRHTLDLNHLTSLAVQKAIRQMRATYLRQLNSDDYARLAYIARHKQMRPEDDAQFASQQKSHLLFHRYALEYLDENDRPWIDVHPLVIETEEFQDAYNSTKTIISS
ncbi:MAG: hypothetical protein JWN14_942 [Chthonomonadales bacterium]|nr:hypothetical protein [Chthonomonadales bacterium]